MKKLLSAILVFSSLSFLTACDSGIAAQVGDTKISTNTVQNKIHEILSARAGVDTSQLQLSTGETLNRAEMRFLLISTVFEKIAAKYNLNITQAMKDSKKSEIYSQVGGVDQLKSALISAEMAPSDFDTYIQSVLISDELIARAKASGIADANTGAAIQQIVMEIAKTEKIKVNPQYGTWDATNADLVAFDSAGTAVKIQTA